MKETAGRFLSWLAGLLLGGLPEPEERELEGRRGLRPVAVREATPPPAQLLARPVL